MGWANWCNLSVSKSSLELTRRSAVRIALDKRLVFDTGDKSTASRRSRTLAEIQQAMRQAADKV